MGIFDSIKDFFLKAKKNRSSQDKYTKRPKILDFTDFSETEKAVIIFKKFLPKIQHQNYLNGKKIDDSNIHHYILDINSSFLIENKKAKEMRMGPSFMGLKHKFYGPKYTSSWHKGRSYSPLNKIKINEDGYESLNYKTKLLVDNKLLNGKIKSYYVGTILHNPDDLSTIISPPTDKLGVYETIVIKDGMANGIREKWFYSSNKRIEDGWRKDYMKLVKKPEFLMIRCRYKNGALNGKYELWGNPIKYDSGFMSSANVGSGYHQSDSSKKYKQGKKILEAEFKNGKLDGRISHFKNGELIFQIKIKDNEEVDNNAEVMFKGNKFKDESLELMVYYSQFFKKKVSYKKKILKEKADIVNLNKLRIIQWHFNTGFNKSEPEIRSEMEKIIEKHIKSLRSDFKNNKFGNSSWQDVLNGTVSGHTDHIIVDEINKFIDNYINKFLSNYSLKNGFIHQLETYIKFEELFIEIISSENYE